MAQQRQPTATLVFPNRENVTTGQIQNVLQICNTAVTGLINPWRGFVGDDDSSPKNSEARIALENTLIKACDRLDKILGDDQRWSIDYQKGLEDEFKRSHSENLKFLESQRRASEEISSPHFQWKPTLMKSQDGKLFSAFLGEPENPYVIGIGRSLEEALEEFDKDFCGKQKSPEVIAFLKARVAEQQMYEQKTLDAGRSNDAGQSSGEENLDEGDRASAQQNDELGEGIHQRLGPRDPRNQAGSIEEGETIPVDFPGTFGSGGETRPSFFRKIAARVSRFFGLDKDRSRG